MKFLFFSHYFWPENFRINELALFFSSKHKENYILTGYPSYPNKGLFKKKTNKENIENSTDYQKLNIIRVPVFLRNNNNVSIILNYISFFFSSLILGGFKIVKKNFDIIFIFCPSPIFSAIPGVIFKLIFKKKSVLWILDLWPNTLIDLKIVKNKLIIKILKTIIKFIYDNTDLILAQSESMCEEIKKTTDTKCIYFPSWPEENIGNDYNLFSDKILPCKKNQIKILFTGNIGEAQSFETLIECAKLLSQKQIVKWIIVGDGRWKKKLEKLIEINKLNDDFQLIENVPLEEIRSFFNHADALYLSLKKNETFNRTIPGKLQTYMTSKKPIIASISGEASRIIKDAQCGFVSDAEDHLALKDNIVAFYNLDINKKKELGLNGKNYSDINFNKKNILNNLNIEIKKILK